MKIFASLTSASALALTLGMAALPGTAHAGFLDQLFGGAPEPAPQVMPAPTYQYDAPGYYQDAPVRHRAKRKVVVDSKPKLQKPTDLMHDATLQTGDAVMTKNGIEVYTGNDGDRQHAKDDFSSLNEIDGMPKQERRELVAMESARTDPLRADIGTDTMTSGRSAAIATPIVTGSKIVDARGKTVRYVGP